ncbi:ArsR/SmtB family transcription factor [Vibrio ostreicida]|uniref:Winged helix-turn-helix domain-containing protein n=1 Tax=Vibrio ostreicida TaxID=526588 RepID=A0ABT8BX18_9VIBR|nr:winged helix-turn-helix domain-containing protein [Vibrio ostreicida]MDN3611367.1 winged helix-turn-helix domain-containing protein [Vibrio ostreicida]NPD09303.1 winged helix-turn-helix transcriptional regulator [Vibrio ostreicida]
MSEACNLANQQALTATQAELQQEQTLASQAKALAHPARIRILALLVKLDSLGGCLNSDLVSELGLAQSTVSEHLRILKQANFIVATPNPPKVCYSVNRTTLAAFNTLYTQLLH